MLSTGAPRVSNNQVLQPVPEFGEGNGLLHQLLMMLTTFEVVTVTIPHVSTALTIGTSPPIALALISDWAVSVRYSAGFSAQVNQTLSYAQRLSYPASIGSSDAVSPVRVLSNLAHSLRTHLDAGDLCESQQQQQLQ